MDSLIVVPCLASTNVDERMLPFISKLIERNIAVNYQGPFRSAIDLLGIEKQGEHLKENNDIQSKSINISEDFLENILLEAAGGKLRPLKRFSSKGDIKKVKISPLTKLVKKISSLFPDFVTNISKRQKKIRKKENIRKAGGSEKRTDFKNKYEDFEELKYTLDAAKAKKYKDEERDKKFKQDIINMYGSIENYEKYIDKGPEKKVTDKAKATPPPEKVPEENPEYKISQYSKSDVPDIMTQKRRGDITTPEAPGNVMFYDTINLEPTIASFPLRYKKNVFKKRDPESRRHIEQVLVPFNIGIKSVIFRVSELEDIIKFMNNITARGISKVLLRFCYRNYRKIFKKIWFTRSRNIYYGRPESRAGDIRTGRILSRSILSNDPGKNPYNDIMYTPDYWELESPKFLKERIEVSRNTWSWGTVLILSKEDFPEEFDYKTFYNKYRKLISIGWGDIVIIDKVKETFNYCSMSLGYCNEVPFSYLKQLLNVSNVLDFGEMSRYSTEAKPFSFGGGRMISSLLPKTTKKIKMRSVFK